MNDKERLAQAVLQAADGEVVGRIRLQKIFYLLEQLGAQGGFRFSYHHYGPYSKGLSETLDWLTIDDIIEETDVPTDFGSYSVYKLKAPLEAPPEMLGGLSWEQARTAVTEMKKQTSIVIELAATIHWLRHKEKVDDWRRELKVRKSQKASDERIGQATALLERLNLAA